MKKLVLDDAGKAGKFFEPTINDLHTMQSLQVISLFEKIHLLQAPELSGFSDKTGDACGPSKSFLPL